MRAASRRPAIRHREKLVTLLEKDGKRLYRLLVRLTLRDDVAEDLLQDLAVKLASADGFAAADSPYAYARIAAMNLAFDWRRRQRPQSVLQDDHGPTTEPPWVHLVRREEIDRLTEQMTRLAERDRTILALRYFDGARFRQISQIVGGTAQQVRGLCHKALGRLRAAMTDKESDGPANHEEAAR